MIMKKKSQPFHSIFQTVPEKEKLLEIYRCAYQKDILIQGHLYVFEHHICFKANIFGWITRIEFSISDIGSIEKRKTIKLFPNAIEIRQKCSQKPHVFTSFISRDPAYQLIMDLWLEHHYCKYKHRQQQRKRHIEKQDACDSSSSSSSSDDSAITTTDDDDGQRNNHKNHHYNSDNSSCNKNSKLSSRGKSDYNGWVLLILTIILLLSDISIAYHITHISYQLMRL